ncbi:uncharacterized protein LOC111240579 isoform X2 [Vigna radiata var. radiata]|uniref:Uncharacterized protein LOC111240579 isoform X2 n=1 Tax=Vigna radiata var. radiata TaxID=3916 RepID=A0A3Q0EKC7_VIGRR|nr:uncharacterized protein LOC111240579 isoform X2 [Vigna radiata var. radiata]
MEAQFDDDSFYAEIRRQILQLTSEDEDLSVEKGFREGGVGGSTRPPPLAKHSCSWEAQSSSSPHLTVNLWKSARGTGVFIPRVVTAKKYQRPGTMNGRKQIYKPVANKY